MEKCSNKVQTILSKECSSEMNVTGIWGDAELKVYFFKG